MKALASSFVILNVWASPTPTPVNPLGSLVVLRPVLTFRSTCPVEMAGPFNSTLGRIAVVEPSDSGCGYLSRQDIHKAIARSDDLHDRMRYLRKNPVRPVHGEEASEDYGQPSEEDILTNILDTVLLMFPGCVDADVPRVVQLASAFDVGGLLFSGPGVHASKATAVSLEKNGRRLPIASFDDILSVELAASFHRNTTSIVRLDPEPVFPCETVRVTNIAAPILAFFWGILVVIWGFILNYWGARHFIHSFDRLIVLVPGCHAMLCLFYRFCWSLCPHFASKAFQFLLLGYMGFAICSRTMFIGMLLILSKGWRISRFFANGREVLLVSVLVSLVYIVESLAHLDSEVSFPGTIGLNILLLLEMTRSIKGQIAFVTQRLAFAGAHVHQMVPDLLLKRRLFRILLVTTCVYFVSDVLARVFLVEVLGLPSIAWTVNSLLELLMWIAVSVVFYTAFTHTTLYFEDEEMNASIPMLPMFQMEGAPSDFDAEKAPKTSDVPLFLVNPPYESMGDVCVALREQRPQLSARAAGRDHMVAPPGSVLLEMEDYTQEPLLQVLR